MPANADPQQSVFIKACRREPVPYVPVWLMRQAGRYMQEYRTVRAKVGFLDLCKTPELCAEAAVTAQEKLNVDAAILFSDILLIVESFGLGLTYEKGDGPKILRPIRRTSDVSALKRFEPADSLSFVMKAVRLTRRSLKPGVPLIGFAGAPFTLASYMIEGGGTRDFSRTRAFMKKEPAAWKELMERITRATAAYLKAQADAGADALQLFDSWAGVLTKPEYESFVLPHSRALFDAVNGRVPTVHFGTGTGKFLKSFASAGSNVVGVDHRTDLKAARKLLGSRQAVQGNLDPRILAEKKPKDIEKAVKKILEAAGGKPGFIFNLGHGVLQTTPVENAIALVESVHKLSSEFGVRSSETPNSRLRTPNS